MEGQTNLLVKNSEEVLKGLKDLQLFSDLSIGDASSSRPRLLHVDFYTMTLTIGIVKSTPIFSVPFAPNSTFLGRQDIIAALDQHFARKDEMYPASIKKAALCGLGGIG